MYNKNILIGFFGIGIFTYFSISSLSYSIGGFLKDSLIYLDLKPSWSFWLSETLRLIFFVLPITLIINWIYKNHESISNEVLKYFVWSFLAYFTIQIVIVIYPWLSELIGFGKNNEGILNYHEYLRQNYMLYFLQSIFYYLGEIIAIVFIYNKIKKR